MRDAEKWGFPLNLWPLRSPVEKLCSSAQCSGVLLTAPRSEGLCAGVWVSQESQTLECSIMGKEPQ